MAAADCRERTNWYQCIRLLMEGGRAVLKEFIKKSYIPTPGSLDLFLKTKEGLLSSLHKRHILNDNQWDKLFPSADLESMDITLLSCVICNCITQPNSVERRAVDDLRELRNSLHGHACTESMNKDEFEINWKNITKKLLKAQRALGVNISLSEFITKIGNEKVVNNDLVKAEFLAWNCIDDEGWSEVRNCLGILYQTLIKSPVTAAPSSMRETGIDDIYAIPELKLKNHKALRKQSADRNETSLNLEDIFFTDGKKCYNIYVTGDPGIGKTSLSKYILSSWCKTQQDKTNNDFDGFEMALKQFDFLFYISLRHAAGQFDIEEMIESQLLKHFVPNNKILMVFESKFILNELFKFYAEQCLIILDGLDEWRATKDSANPLISNGVPMRNPFLKYTIITFTRPWKLEIWRLMDSEVDRQIEITGVKDISIFGEKLITYFNTQENTSMTYRDFCMDLKNAGLNEMKNTPFLLKHLICLWFNNKEFGKSKTDVYTNLLELWFEIAEKREGRGAFKHSNDPSITTPNVFKKNGKCNDYKTLLMAVGKLAFETLLQRDSMKLVFDYVTSDELGVTEDEVELIMSICLKVGILTQSIVPDMTSKKRAISFTHRTFQEYFAALYMGFGKYIENIESIMIDMFEMEEFLIFLSGMKPNEFERLIKVQLEKSFVNIKFIKGQYQEIPCTLAQILVNKCCIESVCQNRNYCPKVNLRGIVWDEENFIDPKHCGLMPTFNKKQHMAIRDSGIIDLSILDELRYIVLRNITATEMCLSPAIEELTLNNIKLLKHSGIVSLMESVVSVKRLLHITMTDITCKELHSDSKQCSLNVDLSKLNNLRSLELSGMSATEVRLSPTIIKLTLNNIKLLKHSGIVSLMESVSNMKNLCDINMTDITCKELHSDFEQCSFDVDLSMLENLIYIELSGMSATEVCLSPTIWKLTLNNIKLLKHSGIVSLMESVSSRKTLLYINMTDITCKELHSDFEQCSLNVDLSKLEILASVELSEMSATEICLSQAIKKLTLYNIKLLKHSGIVSLMESVSTMTRLWYINMTDITCKELHSDSEQCSLNVDLSMMNNLRIIKLSGMSATEVCLSPAFEGLTLDNIEVLKHSGIVSLMESVSTMKTLRYIIMHDIYCREHGRYECFLNVDLSKLDELRHVLLWNITATEVCLSPAIEELYLDDIKMFKHRGVVSLMESVSSMKTLQAIQMTDITCKELHSDSGQCSHNVDLSMLDNLRSIQLSGMSATGVRLRTTSAEFTLKLIKFLKHNGIVCLNPRPRTASVTHSLKMSKQRSLVSEWGEVFYYEEHRFIPVFVYEKWLLMQRKSRSVLKLNC